MSRTWRARPDRVVPRYHRAEQQRGPGRHSRPHRQVEGARRLDSSLPAGQKQVTYISGVPTGPAQRDAGCGKGIAWPVPALPTGTLSPARMLTCRTRRRLASTTCISESCAPRQPSRSRSCPERKAPTHRVLELARRSDCPAALSAFQGSSTADAARISATATASTAGQGPPPGLLSNRRVRRDPSVVRIHLNRPGTRGGRIASSSTRDLRPVRPDRTTLPGVLPPHQAGRDLHGVVPNSGIE